MAKQSRKKKPKKKRAPAWHSMIPGGKVRPGMTLEQLRSAKTLHDLLTEPIKGPPAVANALRAFRLLEMHALIGIAQDAEQPLARCWKELERLFSRDASFRGDTFVPSWILFNFPGGPDGQTPLDRFEGFLQGADHLGRFDTFVGAARVTRLGLYQTVMRTNDVARFRELITGRVVDVDPSFDAGNPGEVVLGRIIELEGTNYFWGDIKAFPADALQTIEDMVRSKMLGVEADATTEAGLYEAFMRLAGPYWMSVVATNEALPILAPDHHLTYFTRPATPRNTIVEHLPPEEVDKLPKLSATILEFAEPILSTMDSPPTLSQMNAAMNLAQIAWNLPLMLQRDPSARVGPMWREMAGQVPGPVRAIVDGMMTERQTTYAHDPRLAEVSVVDHGGGEITVHAVARMGDAR